MKPAPFRLERVRRVRQSELDRAAAAFAGAMTELGAIEAEATAQQRTLTAASRDQRRLAEAGLPAGLFCVRARAIETTREAIGHTEERKRACATRGEETRLALLAARARVRALEKLRARRAQAMSAWRERSAQAELDEVGSRIASRAEAEA